MFSEITTNRGKENIARRDAELHAMACEVLELVITYLAKVEGMDDDKRKNIFKMMRNFKAGSDYIDLPALVKYFRFNE